MGKTSLKAQFTMSHLPLARRYRPQRFADVIGQPQATRALQNALMSGKTTHAYLFSGTRGCGKTTLARLLAKAVNCLALTDEGEPCQNCASCKEITASHSLDVIEIDGASHRGIDDIRQIKESVGFQPSTGKFKVYIVDEVHMLTKEAFNALLKTLEEPPSTVKFILATTEAHKVPSTIASRCQKFALRNIEPAQVVQALEKILASEKIDYEPELLWHLGRRSEGSLRDCLSLLDQLLAFEPEKITLKGLQETLGLAPIERLQSWENLLQKGQIEGVWQLTREIQDGGVEVSVFLEQLQEHYQNILKACYGIEEGPQDVKQLYREFKQNYETGELLFILNRLDDALQNLKSSHHPRLHLEMTLLHLMQKPWKCTIDHLMARLESMQAELAGSSAPIVHQHSLSNTSHAVSVSKPPLTPPQTLIQESAVPVNQTYSTIEPKAAPKALSPQAVSQPQTPPLLQKTEVSKEKELIQQKTESVQQKTAPPAPLAPKTTSADQQTTAKAPAAAKTTTTNSSPAQPSSIAMAPGTFEGLIQFAARELGGHIR